MVLKRSVLGLAVLGLVASSVSCSSENKSMGAGTGIGAAAGGVLGAIIGHQSGNRDKGAMIGAVLGGGVGAVVGSRLDKQRKELETIAETKRTEQGLVTKLKSDILFDSGKAGLKPAAGTNIGQLAAIMKKYPENIITIKGYTDNTGAKTTNEKLSAERAEAVKRALVANGMSAPEISTVGMADANPVAPNDNKTNRAQNRRVEIEITVDESKVPKDQKG
jgi:outer membrane protein OmpA-like peptidoglycan-associated protein